MRIIKITLLFMMLLLTASLPAYASVSTGLAWQSQDGGDYSMEAVKVDLNLSKHWTVQGSYDWENENLSADVLYKPKTDTWFRPYIGIGVRDIMQRADSELSLGDKAEVVAGAELGLRSNKQSGFFLSMEVKAVPSTLFDDSDADILKPVVSVALNYRFPSQRRIRAPQDISKSDFELLARLVAAEAGNEPFEGQVAVAAVVLNRVNSGKFPATIRGVIYQNNQFTSLPKLPGITPSESCYQATTAALNGQDPSRGALYYYNPRTCSREGLAFFRSGKLKTTTKIANHIFLTD